MMFGIFGSHKEAAIVMGAWFGMLLLNLAFLGAGVWVVVKVLQLMGIL